MTQVQEGAKQQKRTEAVRQKLPDDETAAQGNDPHSVGVSQDVKDGGGLPHQTNAPTRNAVWKSSMKRTAAGISALLVMGIVTFVALNWSLIQQIATFSPIILPSFGPAPTEVSEARLQDIDYLARLVQYDRSFDERERSQFEALIAGHRDRAETMSLAQLYLLAGEAAALADNGHTGVSSGPIRSDFNSVGLRYFNFRDGLYVVRAIAGHEALVGGRVLEIDGQPIRSIMAALRIYSGGVEGWRDLRSLLLLESAELLHAAGITESSTGYTLTFVDRRGDTQQIMLKAFMPDPGDSVPTSKPIRNLDAEALPDEGDGWVYTLQDVAADDLALYLQKTTRLFKWEQLQDGGGYVRVQAMANTPDQSLPAFFDESLGPLPDGSLPYLVIDLRANDGGDTVPFVEAAKWLPGKVAGDGHLYVVVGPQTFSAAVSATALLKYYGGERSLIVGAPMGDREQYWTERGLPFRLPNSAFSVGYATGYHDWANGCEEHPYCFPQVLKHGVEAGSLAPNHIVEPTYADYASGRDVVMEWIHQREASH